MLGGGGAGIWTNSDKAKKGLAEQTRGPILKKAYLFLWNKININSKIK